VRASADALAPAFAPVEIDLEGAPKLERKPDAPKEKKKKDGAAAPAADAAKPKKDNKADKALQEGTSEADAGVPVEAGLLAEGKAAEGKAPKAKKEPKTKADAAEGGKKKGGAAPAGKAPAEDAGEPVPSMIDLRVGHIVESASDHAMRCVPSVH
jgi:aminoacyl tRNA synthase complex-interacting multifunctional protein 1